MGFVMFFFEVIRVLCSSSSAPPCLSPRRQHSNMMITCRRHPVPCWRCGSCRAVSERSWGSRGWGFVRSLRRSRCHSSWSGWSSAWRRWWIAVGSKNIAISPQIRFWCICAHMRYLVIKTVNATVWANSTQIMSAEKFNFFPVFCFYVNTRTKESAACTYVPFWMLGTPKKSGASKLLNIPYQLYLPVLKLGYQTLCIKCPNL